MIANFANLPTKSWQHQRNRDREASNNSSQETTDVFVRIPDYTIPMKDAYIVCQEVDGGNSHISQASTFKTDLEKLIAAIINKNTISYVNKHNRKVHVKIFFYGSEESCQLYQENQEILNANSKRRRIASEIFNQCPDTFSSNPIIIDLENSQSGSISEQEQTDSIKDVLEKIKDLHEDVKSIKETLVSSSRPISTSSQDSLMFKPETVKQSELEAKFKSIIIKQRSQREWVSKIKSTRIDFVDNETARLIRQLFIYGTNDPGTFARNLAIYIFGEARLIKTLMGRDGKFLKGIRECDRSEIFTAEEELQVLQLFMLIDEDLFSWQDAFEHLIRNPINQLGRDLKKKFREEQDNNKNGRKSRQKNLSNRPSTSKDN